MDHWGDPWADDDADAAPPKQEEVATSGKPAVSTTPVSLNSFLDDPQWGVNDDEGFVGWETSIGDSDLAHPTLPDARVTDPNPTLRVTKLPAATELHEEEENILFKAGEDGWGNLAQSEEALQEVDNVVSETSDSATTIQPDDGHPRTSTDVSDVPHLDDGLSTRTSTTPSEVSHTEVPLIESPRTSFEDERITGTGLEVSASTHEEEGKTEDLTESSAPQVERVENQEHEEDEFGDFEEDTQEESECDEEEELALGIALSPERDLVTVEPQTEPAAEPELETTEKSGPKDSSASASASSPTGVLSWELDRPMIDQLFQPPNPSKELFDGASEPIATTSTRKAWYRLTRKSTMREYNTGIDDENYVRVTWANSHIKEEAKKIVHRWTTEDRNSGRGHSASASFYWDHSPSNAPITHLRRKSIIAESSPLQPAKQNVPPLSSNVPAAFSWSSSPLAVHGPWRQDSPDLKQTSSPIIATPDALPKASTQTSCGVSVDLTRPTPVQPMYPRTPTPVNPSNPPPATSSFKPSNESDPWANLSSLDTSSLTEVAVTTNDDDDEWGEMVESPAVSNGIPMADFSQSSTPNATLPMPSTTPKSAKCSPFQSQASRHASPIVRLKGAVSPTSSAFRFNNFGPIIPDSTTVEPIGPNLLKRATTNLTPVKTVTKTESAAQPQQITEVQYRRSMSEKEESVDFTVCESSTSQSQPSEIAEFAAFEPLRARPEFSTSDSFTAFESSTPTTAPTPVLPLTPALNPVQPTSLPSPSNISSNTPSSTTPAQTTTDPWVSTMSASAPLASIPQTPIDPWFDTSSSNLTIPAPALVEDPWSNADFSFFESAAPALPQAENPLSPSDSWSVFNTPVSAAALPQIEAPIPIPSQKLSIPGGMVLNSEQKRRAEEEKVIREILEGLPDLGYMLR
jgi:hypothetical protein